MITPEEYNTLLQGAAYKDYNECSPQELAVLAKEKDLCSKSISRFIKYVKILQPPTQTNPGGEVKFELWEHVKKFLSALLHEKLIVLLKSRQIGASWTIAVFCLWKALFNEGDTTLLFSKGKTEAAELLAKCRRVYMSLPPFLKIRLDPDSATEIGFPSMKSSIKAFAATETAGISFTASRIVADEWIEHPFAEQNYLASKPCIDAGGQFIGIFTINKEKLSSLPVGIFNGAVKKKNGFCPLFFGYSVRPERSDEWYKQTMDSIPESELGTLTPGMYMACNYPKTIAEALSPAQTIAAFNLDSLKWMMGETKNPIPQPEFDNAIVHVYKPHSLGNFYIAGTDTSHGVGKDYSVTLLLNVKTGEVVADVMSNIISEEELAMWSVKLLNLYGKPLWFIEDNDWGRSTILAAERMNYRNFGYQDKEKKKPGFRTVGGDSGRNALWGSLIPAINNKQVIVYNIVGLSQFFDVIRNAEKGGRIEAMANRHDDYPMALAIAWYKKNEVHTEEVSYQPIETAHFR
jgi:hypothetical protein